MTSLSNREARHLALAAQGLDRDRPARPIGADDLMQVIDRIGLLQIDSVNVLARSHYLPLFARLGPYDSTLLDALTYEHRRLFEYWGHAASFLPVDVYPLLRHRMDRWADGHANRRAFLDANSEFIEAVLAQVRERGPLEASTLDEPGQRSGPWWGYGKGKIALEMLFGLGEVAVAGRRNFARIYDLAERVIPHEHAAAEPMPVEEAHRALLLKAARHLGIGTARDLADYYRLPFTAARARLRELVDAGALETATVEDWPQPAYLLPGTPAPDLAPGRTALLSPFDSLVWERDRNVRLFGFHYRIEIYTPEPKRQYGYYVMPFLLGNELVGRIDLKADRKSGCLRVQAAHAEPGVVPGAIVEPLAAELRLMAGWLGLERVAVEPRGNLAPSLLPFAGPL